MTGKIKNLKISFLEVLKLIRKYEKIIIMIGNLKVDLNNVKKIINPLIINRFCLLQFSILKILNKRASNKKENKNSQEPSKIRYIGYGDNIYKIAIIIEVLLEKNKFKNDLKYIP